MKVKENMSEAIKLFQYNTLSALMAGLYGGTLTLGELLEHGDFDIIRNFYHLCFTIRSFSLIRFEMTDKELEKRIESYYDGVNLFRSIKIKGTFVKMHVRMIPKSAPDIKFADVATRQPEYTRENISGTIVGIWTPKMFHGVSVAGYHLHFISDDFTFGGHVMDFIISEGVVEVGPVDQLDQRFPVQDRKYLFAKFNMDELKEDIEKSE